MPRPKRLFQSTDRRRPCWARLAPRRWYHAALCALALSSCVDAGKEREPVTVFAASSLAEAFGEVEREFEATHPNTDVRLTFAGSQVLRLQLEQGAQADVFASANEQHTAALVDQQLLEPSHVFAKNELVAIVPARSDFQRLQDLERAQRLVIGTRAVPVGAYTRQMLSKAEAHLGKAFTQALERAIVSEENNVLLVRAKVELGEADAAFVYRTDALSGKRVKSISLPPELATYASYPISVVSKAKHKDLAQRFVEFVRSPAGQGILERFGFTPFQS